MRLLNIILLLLLFQTTLITFSSKAFAEPDKAKDLIDKAEASIQDLIDAGTIHNLDVCNAIYLMSTYPPETSKDLKEFYKEKAMVFWYATSTLTSNQQTSVRVGAAVVELVEMLKGQVNLRTMSKLHHEPIYACEEHYAFLKEKDLQDSLDSLLAGKINN